MSGRANRSSTGIYPCVLQAVGRPRYERLQKKYAAKKRRKRESKIDIAVGLFDMKVFILTTCVPIRLKEVKRVIRNSKIPKLQFGKRSMGPVKWAFSRSTTL